MDTQNQVSANTQINIHKLFFKIAKSFIQVFYICLRIHLAEDLIHVIVQVSKKIKYFHNDSTNVISWREYWNDTCQLEMIKHYNPQNPSDNVLCMRTWEEDVVNNLQSGGVTLVSVSLLTGFSTFDSVYWLNPLIVFFFQSIL